MLQVLMLVVAATAGYSRGYEVKDGDVTFMAEGSPGFVHIEGEGGKLRGQAEERDGKFNGTFLITLSDFDTGLSLRNTHMKEKYLNVKKYPEAKLILTGWKQTAAPSRFDGKLTLKGVTKPVHGMARLSDSLKLFAEFTIVLDDFKIGVPSWAGITVAKDVTISVEATAIGK